MTQQFNTTTSMGRLTLNVLLSFAQFEREVTSERIRDKISASKRKGLWVGGMAPLGYDTKDRKITINEAEAEWVRTIFRSYVKLGSLNLLIADLRKRNIITKVRTLNTGETVGRIPFAAAHSPTCCAIGSTSGRSEFKGEILNGEQPAILDRGLFDAERAGSVRRVSATEIEPLVIRSVRERLNLSEENDDQSLINAHVAQVKVRPEQLVIRLADASAGASCEQYCSEMFEPSIKTGGLKGTPID